MHGLLNFMNHGSEVCCANSKSPLSLAGEVAVSAAGEGLGMIERMLSPHRDDSQRPVFSSAQPSRMLVAASLVLALLSSDATQGDEFNFFETKIRSVLVEHCYECHSSNVAKPKGELRLDSRAATRMGGESGPVIVPGNVKESLLIDAIEHKSLEMPPDEKLPASVIEDFKRWVEMGAPDPRDTAGRETDGASSWEDVFQERKKWWSLQPVKVQSIPTVKDKSWSDHPIDRFLLAKLEMHGLQPAPVADAGTLARRLSFVLTGLPPGPDDAAALADRGDSSDQ